MKTWMAGLCVVMAACGTENPRGAGLDTDEDNVQNGNGRADGGVVDGGTAGNGNGTGNGTGTNNGNGTGNGNGNTCSKFTVRADRAIPDMLILLDRSGSMAPSGNDSKTDRWGGSVDAVTEIVGSYDDQVSFGLMTFPKPNQGSGQGQCAPGGVDVSIGAARGAQIADILVDGSPGGNTPTAATLAAALPVITKATAANGVTAAKYVLLVTDGEPNCSANWPGKGDDPAARTESIAAIAKLTQAGVKTFVVGYQTAGSSFAGQLDKMAAAGGTGETKHRSVNSGDDLASAFEAITQRAVSCTYRLEKPVTDPTYVLITVGDKPRAYNNTADGWTLGADKQTVTLEGAACQALQQGEALSVEVTCEQVVVI